MTLDDLVGRNVQFSFGGLLVAGRCEQVSRRFIDVTLSAPDGTDEPDGLPGDLVSYDLDVCAGILTVEQAS